MNRINKILKEEMEAIGAQEISMPILHPAEVWQKTGRWYEIKDEMFRLKDRTDRDMCLGMTHEEIMTWLASREIRSYRHLPQIWYQIQTKLRDEARPKSGVLRTREFIMKDSYSFDMDEQGLEENYHLHAKAYHRIFERCGLAFYQVESDPGMMGGATAHEFMAPSPAGEDYVIICKSCGYTANIEVASSVSPAIEFSDCRLEEIHTPGKKTVKEVSYFMNIKPHYFIKSLLFITDKEPVLALLRGDQELHEKKLLKIIGNFRQATKDEIISTLGVEPGFIGPIGHKIQILGDLSLKEGSYITGANKPDYHIKGVMPNVHFNAEWHDLHVAKEGEQCSKCNSLIRIEKAIEIGNIFKLGTKYSMPLNAVFLDKEGQERHIIMGSYGIGPARIAAAAIEQNYDKDGIIWPKNIAPFDLEIIPLSVNDKKTMEVLEILSGGLTEKGIEVIIDDRDERPGVKFKDADLIGVPVQVVLGEKSLKDNQIEIKSRRTKETKKVPVDNAIEEIIAFFRQSE
ncbi:MAG: proline--tRNA ligase [Nitrospirae bacterium GWB2_47_37]|nr:MAG: proline--tRNA ligase [Nitrospirae bacterium GWB2_47_37]